MANETKIRITADAAQAEATLRKFDSAVGSLTNTLGGLLSSAAIVSGLKNSLEASNQYQAALTGLASTARYAGEDITKTITVATKLTADGMISTTEAASALKNLLSRGFSTDQAVEMINRLKDSAAFGRQASLGFGEAVVSATEGLKNENSILVDNAGVTKNVSVMWKEYAAQIGTTADKLTQAQKREAEYAGLMQETAGQVGNAAIASAQLDGDLAKMNKTTQDSAVLIGQSLTPAASMLARAFTDLLDVSVKPAIFFFQSLGIRAAELAAKVGLVFDALSTPAKLFRADERKLLKSQFDDLSNLAEAEMIALADKLNKPLIPNIGGDSGARRKDVVLPGKSGESKQADSYDVSLYGKGFAMDAVASEQAAFDERINAATVYHEKAQTEASAHAQMMQIIEADHQAKLIELGRKGALSREQFEKLSGKTQVLIATGTMQDIIGASAENSRAMFNMMKALRLADAAVALPSAVMKAYDAGAWGGPPVSAAYAALAFSAQMIQMNAIKNASFGGGGGGSAPSGGGSVSSVAIPGQVANPSVIPAASSPAAGVSIQDPAKNINLTMIGTDFYSPAAIRDQLIPAINEAAGDGVNIKVTMA